MFELRNVSKSYGGRQVLAPIDLQIATGQTMVLIGPSGCGKSTLLRLLLGLIEPDSGTVLFGGREMSGSQVIELRHEVGYVIQGGGLFPHLTARGNVTLLADYLDKPEDEINRRVEELRELTHLPDGSIDRYPGQLSGGQQQRVALMRGLMLDPAALLMDEPLGALDPLIRAELQKDLREIFRSLKKTVVFVTHDIGEAAYLADEIVLLREGRVVQRGTIEDLLHRPADPFVSDFISAQRNPLEDMKGAGT
ncbi:Choline transport ATP-binding protein OpuBA [Maioricimonas rarisocia]|uniref:Choline transport ATP-binding protein OpuBA n=1 Tax=Maioricimonas rarisocia TaxID=2528026 RepID=A0A517Z8G1_9PLAN|nr:ATP-binding cassette domain-containing protein [Maioricimonas rarisocia]QDU38739.1 Choline transport ATP-binding protein OpuBA [Maioricimonas rarisocia]